MEENVENNNTDKDTNRADQSITNSEENISMKVDNKSEQLDSVQNQLISNNNEISKFDAQTTDKTSIKNESKPKKEIPIEKKPFKEFVNLHLIPTLIEEFNKRGFTVDDINLKNEARPIAKDKCWVVYCEIKDTCNFWLSFEKDDITSLKSISLSKPNQKPSIIESFLIDEKRITLKLIISRVLQRLNGQKLIGFN